MDGLINFIEGNIALLFLIASLFGLITSFIIMGIKNFFKEDTRIVFNWVKTFAIILGFCIIAEAVVFYNSAIDQDLLDNAKNATETIEHYKNECIELQNTIANLHSENNVLRSRINELEDEISDLQYRSNHERSYSVRRNGSTTVIRFSF